MTEPIHDIKRAVRARMKLLRERISPGEYRRNSDAIAARLTSLPEWAGAGTVHIYVASVNNEADTRGLIGTLLGQDRRVVVPKCMSRPRRLSHIRLASLDELGECAWGLMEPAYSPEREVAPREFDLIVTPLLAFDREGGRLGFGGGYYDVLFSETSCPRIGLAFSSQEIDRVPMEAHDGRLDMIVTETETIRVHDERTA